MSRNAMDHFGSIPSANIPRSRFMRDTSHKTSGNVGDIIPFYVDEVLPGDTFDVNTSFVCRLQSLIQPIMDNVYLDTYYFFVPNRIVWEHWKQFNGENTQSAWIPETEYFTPVISSPEGGWQEGTIADYFGIPTKVPYLNVNALPFRAYAMICNEWFRDENNSPYLDIPFGDATVQGSNGNTFVTDVAKGGKPYRAAKLRDYFTSCLPSPQKGQPVQIGLVQGNAPVYASINKRNLSDIGSQPVTLSNLGPISYTPLNDDTALSDSYNYVNGIVSNGVTIGGTEAGNVTIRMSRPGNTVSTQFTPNNLYADLTNSNSVTINELRLAFATQEMYEKMARGGSRYVEFIQSFFGVESPDARQNRPEYLGGHRVNININQVISTNQTDGSDSDYGGQTSAYSNTSDSHHDFTKSFTEHGFVIGVCVMRYEHTYQQGLNRMWTRRKMTDYYLPVFANLGEQRVYEREIFIDPTEQRPQFMNDTVFGYNEAWSDYRYKPSMVTSEMRSNSQNSLDVWHLGDYYENRPVLESDWIFEDKNNVDRVLRVPSQTANQFFIDFYIKNDSTRPMPLYSIPATL